MQSEKAGPWGMACLFVPFIFYKQENRYIMGRFCKQKFYLLLDIYITPYLLTKYEFNLNFLFKFHISCMDNFILYCFQKQGSHYQLMTPLFLIHLLFFFFYFANFVSIFINFDFNFNIFVFYAIFIYHFSFFTYC